jgi:diadenosine tetraphosphate (Ap4A) HIT family hydrolase
MSDQECVFCGIVAGTVESSKVYENDRILAFMDLQPVTTGHLLIIPRDHATFLVDLDEDLGAEMFRVGLRLAAALRNSELPCEGVNMLLADGETAFQEVLHVHLHVFPRTVGDGFRIEADWRVRPRDELDGSARLVREGLFREDKAKPRTPHTRRLP